MKNAVFGRSTQSNIRINARHIAEKRKYEGINMDVVNIFWANIKHRLEDKTPIVVTVVSNKTCGMNYCSLDIARRLNDRLF